MVDRRRLYRAQNQDITIQESLGRYRYIVNGARGKSYTVNLSRLSCTCPDWKKRQPSGGCKHILRVKLEQGLIDQLQRPYTNFGNPTERTSGTYSNWEELSRRTKQRDYWECQRCGAKGGSRGHASLSAHHIVPKSKGGKDRSDNLITLCQECHEKEHGHSIPKSSNYKEHTWTTSKRGESESESSKVADSVSTTNSRGGSQSSPDESSFDGSNGVVSNKNRSSEPESDSSNRPDRSNQIKTEYYAYTSITGNLILALLGAVVLAIPTYLLGTPHVHLIVLGGAVFVFSMVRMHSKRVKRDIEALENHHDELLQELEKLRESTQGSDQGNPAFALQVYDKLVAMESLIDSAEIVIDEDYIQWVADTKISLQRHWP